MRYFRDLRKHPGRPQRQSMAAQWSCSSQCPLVFLRQTPKWVTWERVKLLLNSIRICHITSPHCASMCCLPSLSGPHTVLAKPLSSWINFTYSRMSVKPHNFDCLASQCFRLKRLIISKVQEFQKVGEPCKKCVSTPVYVRVFSRDVLLQS